MTVPDSVILAAGAVTILIVYAIGAVTFDSWARRCVDCHRHWAVFRYRRCLWHRVKS